MRSSIFFTSLVLLFTLFTPKAHAAFIYDFVCSSKTECFGFGQIKVKDSAVLLGSVSGMSAIDSIIKLDFTFTNIDRAGNVAWFNETDLIDLSQPQRLSFDIAGNIDILLTLGDVLTPRTQSGARIDRFGVIFDTSAESRRDSVDGSWVRQITTVSSPLTFSIFVLGFMFVTARQFNRNSK